MATKLTVDSEQLQVFFRMLEHAARGGLQKEFILFLENLGNEFLRIVEEEIIKHNILNRRLLVNSFHKGDSENIWEIDEGNLILEVGSNLSYAGYINDGYWTSLEGEEHTFVPGYWEGECFIYDSSAKSGMVLKQKWVEGKHYWESALRILNEIYPELLETKIQRWVDSFFK